MVHLLFCFHCISRYKSKVLVFKGIQLSDGASKSSSKEFQGLHGLLRIRRHQETSISKGFEDWGVIAYKLNNYGGFKEFL